MGHTDYLQVIYGPRRLTEDAFVPNVREIVKSISDIAEEIPSVTTANYPGLSPDSSTRASAYLHLMLYQVDDRHRPRTGEY